MVKAVINTIAEIMQSSECSLNCFYMQNSLQLRGSLVCYRNLWYLKMTEKEGRLEDKEEVRQ
jgi:hypothetical protein